MATLWPPKSPKAALLSSPSGRQKYQKFQEHADTYTSPPQTFTMPSVQRTSQRLFKKQGDIGPEDMEEEDEDEETLQLKLAAIEAKLKLKKLQQSRARLEVEPPETKAFQDKTHTPSTSATVSNRLHGNEGQIKKTRGQQGAVEVPISPVKKAVPSTEQRSPSRFLLGIDKGMRGDDISLRRAHTTRDGIFQRRAFTLERPSARRSAIGSLRANTSSATATGRQFKSFSEKIAEGRSVEKSKENRREAVIKSRRTSFKLNQGEMASLRLVAEEARSHNPPKSVKYREEVKFRRDDILISYGEQKATSPKLKHHKMVPELRSRSRKPAPSSENDDGNAMRKGQGSEDSSLFEAFSQLHLSTRFLPHTFLQRTLLDENYTSLCLPDLLRIVHGPLYELPESVLDYVVFGIVASKSSPQDHKTGTGNAKSTGSGSGSSDWEKQWEDGSQNQRKFMVVQLTDLTWSIDLFLFGTALPRYHRLSLGTVVAILNPGIMPPKKGKEDTGAFSLTLHNGDDTVLEIGMARDLGFCKAVKKDGKECGSWVNSAKTEYCEWHLHAQVSKAQAGRMGVNSGSNRSGLGGGGGPGARGSSNPAHVPCRGRDAKEGQGLLPRKGGQRFDVHTGSHYYIASTGGGSNSGVVGTPTYYPDRSVANLLDMDDNDPFIAEGQLSRDSESRLRKRLVAEEKERNIARNLAQMNSGGAGGEYIRQRLGVDSSSVSEQCSQKPALGPRVDVLNSDRDGKGSGKRSAESVRLSPIKKTRLVTDKGIRHPGRESLGTKNGPSRADEDDDLEIV